MRPDVLLFDVDDTLYPPTTGLWDEIGKRIDRFIFEQLKLPEEEITPLRRDLYNRFGTTMRGLQILYNVDPHLYLDYVHTVPLEQFLKPNPELGVLLRQIPIRKIIFTNADSKHARRVIDYLGIGECFDQVVDILDVAPYCKPMPEAYRKMIEILNIQDPARVVLFEDTHKNILTANELGFYTIQVGKSPDPTADDYLSSMQEIQQLFLPDYSLRWTNSR
jgi:putative hydrolase of the HAD superfamily